MAIGMMKLRNGSKGKGVAHFNYIMREDKYKPHADKFEKFENSGHGNMPQWAKDNPKIFWQEADKHERQNGRIYKEHIIALPRELNEAQRLELVNDWIKSEIGDKHPYSFAIHTPQGMDGKDQPHVHFMFSQRTHDDIERSPDQFFKRYNSKNPEKGGAKKANETLTKTQSKDKTKEQRLRLGDFINKHLERAGSKSRVDMRNWKEKGLDQKPLNITYKEMKDPLVEKAYKAKIEAQAEIKEAIKERIEMIGFGKSKAIIKDLEIRIAQEQASKAYSMPKSRQGQWVRHHQKEQGEAVTTPPPQEQKQQEQKAELIKAQHEKMANMSKGEVLPSTYEKIKQFPADKLDKFKAGHDQRAERIAEKAQHELLTPQELEDYSFSKKVQISLDRLQQEKAELHQKQLETLNSFKAEPTQENINQAQGFTNEKLNELKAEAEQSKGEIEQLVQRQELNQTHLKKYVMAKRTLNTIEQVAKERAEQKDQQEHETPTNPPPPQAQKIPQEQTPPAEQLGHGLSEKDESNIKGMREIIKATFANDPAKLKIALERLDKQAEAVSRGEIKLSDQSFVTKEAPKFEYEQKQEQKTSNEIKR